MAIECKTTLKVVKYSLVVEVKLKMIPYPILTFSISALPLDVNYQMSVHFLHLWTLCQKSSPQIFYKSCNSRDIEQNVKKRGDFGASCIASILNHTRGEHWQAESTIPGPCFKGLDLAKTCRMVVHDWHRQVDLGRLFIHDWQAY